MGRSTLVRGAIFLATVAAASAILVLGTGSKSPDLEVGDIASQTYVADRSDTIEDIDATERARQEARDRGLQRPFPPA